MSQPTLREDRPYRCLTPVSAARWRWRLIALLLLGVVMNVGCGPELLYFLWPTSPPNNAVCKLTNTKSNPKVVILAFHAGARTQTTDLFDVDRQLAEHLAQVLKKRFTDHGERVTVVEPYKVREYQAKNYNWQNKSPHEIGKHFEADYVISLEIQKMSLYKEGSMRTLYEGRSEITVAVTDVNGPTEQGAVFTKNYQSSYPPQGPTPADESLGFFRAKFIDYMALDLSVLFAMYETGDKFHF
jgi:hypothetical protein